jgi:hypothetical protein
MRILRATAVMLYSAAVLFGQLSLPNAVPMPGPEIQYLDKYGKPLAGSKLCTYAAGTTTPLATYTDSTAATPNANPIILDVNGRASVWVGPQLYKFVLRTGGDGTCATGSVAWTQDNVSDTTLYFANYVKTIGTSTLLTYTDPLTGAVQRTVSSRLADIVTVKDFNAKGDGVTDDTNAIQAAVNALAGSTAQGGTLVFPCGTYVTTAKITVPMWMTLAGQGSSLCSTINYTTASGAAIVFASPVTSTFYRRGGLRDLQINGTSATNTAVGVFLGGDPSSAQSPSAYQANHQFFQNVTVQGFGTGFQVGNNAYNDSFFDCLIQTDGIGVLLPGGVTNSGANMNFHGGIFLGNTTAGVQTNTGSHQFYFFGTQFEFNKAGVSGSTISANFYGANFENNSDSGCSTCGPFVQTTNATGYYKILIEGGIAQYDTSPSTALVNISGTIVNFSVKGLTLYASASVTEAFNISASVLNASAINIEDLNGDETNQFIAVLNSSAPPSIVHYLSKGNATTMPNQQCFGCLTPIANSPVTIGEGSAQFPSSAITIQPTTHATSRRASQTMGDWTIQQDLNGTGAKDYGLYNGPNNLVPFSVGPNGQWGLGPNSLYQTGITGTIGDYRTGGITTLDFVAGSGQVSNPLFRFYGGTLPNVIGFYVGNGNPNSTVTATQGSMYLNQAGNAGNTLWMKETGIATNTGWVPYVGAASTYSGTKTAGSCVLTITNGLITNVSGC